MLAIKLVVFLSVWTVVICNDIRAGVPDRRQQLIFDKTYDYKANIYVRSEQINVVADENSVISSIEVIDKRPDKDGFAKITQGGVGEKFVSIELKGPGVFRDMTFEVKAYAVDNRLSNFANGIRQNFQNGVQKAGEYVSGAVDRVNGQVADVNQKWRSEPLEYGTKTGNYVYDRQAPEGNYNANYGVKA